MKRKPLRPSRLPDTGHGKTALPALIDLLRNTCDGLAHEAANRLEDADVNFKVLAEMAKVRK